MASLYLFEDTHLFRNVSIRDVALKNLCFLLRISI